MTRMLEWKFRMLRCDIRLIYREFPYPWGHTGDGMPRHWDLSAFSVATKKRGKWQDVFRSLIHE